MIKTKTIGFLVVLLIINSSCKLHDPEPRTFVQKLDKYIKTFKLDCNLEVKHQDMYPGKEGFRRIKNIIRGALPNLRQGSLLEAWVNTAIIVIKTKKNSGEFLPISMHLKGIHDVILTWGKSNIWNVKIKNAPTNCF